MADSASTPMVSDQDIREILQEVVADVLEQFAFMFVAPVESNGIKIPGGGMLRAEIHFKGPFSGWLSLCATQPFCSLLASNVLGMDPEELTLEHAHDALKELVNVTCGELLVAISGKQTLFDLSVPIMESMTDTAFKTARTCSNSLLLMVDDEPLLISAGLTAS